MVDIENKIQCMLTKKLSLEDKIVQLDAKGPCLGKYFQMQIEPERKVLLRQLCDVKIRLRNLRREKGKERVKEKVKEKVEETVKAKTRDNSFISPVEKSPRTSEDSNTSNLTDIVSEDEDSDCLEDSDSFYTACDTIIHDLDLSNDLEEDIVDEFEAEANEYQEARPVVPLLPVLQHQKTELLRELREGKEDNMESVSDSLYESEEDLPVTSSLKPRTETERKIASWVKKNKSNIVQHVRKLTESSEEVQLDQSLLDTNFISTSSLPTVVKEKKLVNVNQESTNSSSLIILNEREGSDQPVKEVLGQGDKAMYKRVIKSRQ